MIIGIPVYQQVDLLDVAGPHEMFKWYDCEYKRNGTANLLRSRAHSLADTGDTLASSPLYVSEP